MEEKSTEINAASMDSHAKKASIAKQTMSMEHITASTDIEADLKKAMRLPLGEISSLGTAFSSLPTAFRTATQQVAPSAGQFYEVILPEGATGVLKSAGENRFYGSALMQDGPAKLAKLRPVDAIQQVTVPYDPTSLFMAAALMEINKKLDAIQETQKEMFDYIKNKDKAQLRGDLETLSDVLSNYRFNWDNAQYKSNKHILVQRIRNDAEKAVIQHRAEIKGKLTKKGPIHIDWDVREKASAVRSDLDEYRLAVYLYAFSSFLEVMLLENFDPDYLTGVVDKIEGYSIAYRQLYTQVYDFIEEHADSSVRAIALGGLSGAMGLLGKAIERTPVGDCTLIDEALQDAGKGLGEFNADVKNGMMDEIVKAKSSDVRPFVDSIENVNRLYNDPVMLLA